MAAAVAAVAAGGLCRDWLDLALPASMPQSTVSDDAVRHRAERVYSCTYVTRVCLRGVQDKLASAWSNS